MKNIRELRLEGQNLSEIPESLTALGNLRDLSLKDNKLVKFPSIVLKFPKLYSLNL